jgi:hypothetical protein
MTSTLKAGDEFVAYPECSPRQRVFIRVTRVARDGSWADIACRTWAVEWRKRQPLTGGELPGNTVPHTLTQSDLDEQEADHMQALREAGVVT